MKKRKLIDLLPKVIESLQKKADKEHLKLKPFIEKKLTEISKTKN